MSLPRRFARHLARVEWLRAGDPVLVALSGGLDSIALLHLCRFTPGLPFGTLSAAHFDHRMRPGSAADAAWVRGVCRAWRIPLEEGASTRPLANEAAARDARYAFLDAAADRTGAVWILTAHHADDQAETVLFRLMRGAGPAGLVGIHETRGRVARPLLPFRRAELEAYARRVGLRWREDPTNMERRYTRNRIRLDVLPALERARPGATAALARAAHLAAEQERAWRDVLDRLESELVRTRSDGAFALARERLLAYPSGVRARVLRRLLRRLGSQPGRSGTRAALEFISTGASGGRIDLPGGAVLERSFDRILVRRSPTAASADDRPVVIPGPGPGRAVATIGGRRWAVSWGPEPAGDGERAAFGSSQLRFPLELRGWTPGDRIRLAYGRKKLKKLFAERRVDRSERSRIPLLAADRARVLWVVGLVRAAGSPPRAGEPALHITVRHDDG